MLSIDDAKKKIISKIKQVETINVDIESAFNFVLAKPLIATLNSPSFSNSSMDGFCVIAADTLLATKNNPVKLNIIGNIPAGVKPKSKIKKGETFRIMTGAMMPPDANAVIPVEKTNLKFSELEDNKAEFVEISDSIQSGDYVRNEGEDFQIGEKLLKKGKILKPQDLSILAMMGIHQPKVFRKPKIAIFSTGDELLGVNQTIKSGKIRESNSFAISALIERYGGEVSNLGIARDNEKDIKSLLMQAVTMKVDLIISTAGVSMGLYDYVRKVIEINGSLNFWKVNMRPGKPLVFGEYKNIPIFGLPGNPVSAYISFEVFVRDVIKYMRGENLVTRRKNIAIIQEDIVSDGRESFLRAIVETKCQKTFAKIAGHQGSGNIFSLVKANALLLVPAGVTNISKGNKIEYWNI